MKWFDRLFERPAPTGREPVKDAHPATREEMAELGRMFATPPLVESGRRVRPLSLFNSKPNPEDGSFGPGRIF